MNKKYFVVLFLTITMAVVSFAYNIAYIPEINVPSMGYDNITYSNVLDNSCVNNPASLSFGTSYQLSFSYYDYLNLGILNIQQFYIKQPLKDGYAGLFSLQRAYSSKTDDNRFDNWVYDYSFSSLSKNISFGLGIKYITENSFYYTEEGSNSSVSYLSGDLGIIMKFNNFSLGALAKNFMNYKFSPYAIDIQPSYTFSLNYFMKNLSIEAAVGKEFNESSYWGGMSAGLKFMDLIFRGGLRVKTDFSEYHLKDAAFGISAKISNIVINYAFKTNLITNPNSLKSNFLSFSFVW